MITCSELKRIVFTSNKLTLKSVLIFSKRVKYSIFWSWYLEILSEFKCSGSRLIGNHQKLLAFYRQLPTKTRKTSERRRDWTEWCHVALTLY